MARPDRLPWIIPESCECCADCVSRCPTGALALWETHHEGVHVPWIAEVDACNGCGACERACPWGGISLTSFVDDARTRLLARRPVVRPVEEGSRDTRA
jgi:ferredoxin